MAIQKVIEDMAVDYYNQGHPVKDILGLTGLNPNTFYKLLKTRGDEVTLRQPRGTNKYEGLSEEEVVDQLVAPVFYLMEKGSKPSAIAKTLGVDIRLVNIVIKERL